MRVYENESDKTAKLTLLMPRDVVEVRTGPDVDTKPPSDGRGKQEHLLQIVVVRDDNVFLAAEDVDDML